MSAYSALKVIHHQDRLDLLRANSQPTPTQVQLIISDLCNQDCEFCAYRMSGYLSNQLFTKGAELAKVGHDNPKRMIPFEKIIEILDDCVSMGVKAIQLTGGGEPTVHPKHIQVFDEVLTRDLDLALVTNGMKLGKGWKERLVEAKWVRFSVDAGTPETYARIRRIGQSAWDRVWKHVRQLAERRDATGSDVVIGVGFVVTKENWREIPQCVERARYEGADNVRISALFQNEGASYFYEIYDEVCERVLTAKSLAKSWFSVYDNFGDRLEDLRQEKPDYRACRIQHFNTYIGGDLNVYRCCVLAYNERGIIGSIKDQSFKELWESESKRLDFDRFDARGCPRCMFNQKNRVISYALEKNPQHVNFV